MSWVNCSSVRPRGCFAVSQCADCVCRWHRRSHECWQNLQEPEQIQRGRRSLPGCQIPHASGTAPCRQQASEPGSFLSLVWLWAVCFHRLFPGRSMQHVWPRTIWTFTSIWPIWSGPTSRGWRRPTSSTDKQSAWGQTSSRPTSAGTCQNAPICHIFV